MIKIVSRQSGFGGSTTAFINLCNLFNRNRIDCEYYGPHRWHLGKCRGKKLKDFYLRPGDRLIVHYLNSESHRDLELICNDYYRKDKAVRLDRKLKLFISGLRSEKVRKSVFSCHEKEVFPLKGTHYFQYDKIHYVSELQRQWHSVDHPYFICSNVLDELEPSPSKPEKVAGIVGTIMENKQVHVSIERAMQDGMRKIIIYGNIGEKAYFDRAVQPFLGQHPDLIELRGYCEDKQSIYDSVSDVYHSSLSESWGYIKGECERTGTRFHGNASTNGYQFMSNQQILDRWIQELEL